MNSCNFNPPYNVGESIKIKNYTRSVNLFKKYFFELEFKNVKKSWSLWDEVHHRIYKSIKKRENLINFQRCKQIAPNICGGGGEHYFERFAENIGSGELDIYLKSYTENLIGSPVDVINFNGTFITRTAIRHLYHAAFLSRYIKHICNFSPLTFIEIGGGFGNLCRIINDYKLANQYIIIDLPVMLCIQYFYLSFFTKDHEIAVVDINGEFIHGNSDSKIILLHTNLSNKISDFVKFYKILISTVSLTEIDPLTQDEYLKEVCPDIVYIYGQKVNFAREGGKWTKDSYSNAELMRNLYANFHGIFYRDYNYNFEFLGKRCVYGN